MPNQNSQLLTTTERLDIYSASSLNDAELREYFTFNKKETTVLKSFTEIEKAVYFAIALVFFKLKRTFVNFDYQEVTAIRRHVMGRYFPSKLSPRQSPTNRDTVARIEKQILKLCDYNRFSIAKAELIKKELLLQASYHPRQRQLCKSFLDLLIKHRIAIPAYSTIQEIITEIWNTENKRLTTAFMRQTNKQQRNDLDLLLNKTDRQCQIISIRQDMRSFNKTELDNELAKHDCLKPIFEAATEVLPKLGLPPTTINYYASLIDYYNGARLKQINKTLAQFYMLCYCYSRYQKLNDNLLEALKKRTNEYKKTAGKYAADQTLKQLKNTESIRLKVSGMLISVKQYPEDSIPKKEIYKHIPEDEILIAAQLLSDEELDEAVFFWKYIDEKEGSIKVNLRNIFLTLDLSVTNDDLLAAVIMYLKNHFHKEANSKEPLPSHVLAWIKRSPREQYLTRDDEVIHNRLEFYLYMQIVHHIATNKLTLKHTIKHKVVDDDFIPAKRWRKEKKKKLKELDYSKLQSPIRGTIKTKRIELSEMYQQVNSAIINGENKDVKIVTNKFGDKQWRLRPLGPIAEPNESILSKFQQRSIVDVIHFVDSKLKFTNKFESILPKSKKGEQDTEAILAVTLANAIRIGARKISAISDLNESSLITAEAAYIRTEILNVAIDAINEETAKFPIFREWYIDAILHGSMDGMKEECFLPNIFARESSKYFGTGAGVSAYNEIVNNLSVAGHLIGAQEYEGNFSFEMVHHQNASEIRPERISTDKHGTNSLNFGLFDLTDIMFAPRIPKPHNETFWGFGCSKDYDGYIIRPTKFFKEETFIGEWDNIQRMVASFMLGETLPNIAIRKLSSNNYSSPMKKAFVQYNHIVRSQFLLRFIHDSSFRRAILIALNRGEAYNGLCRAIELSGKGLLRGKSEIEMEVWFQCTRLIAAIILYYNTYILNSLYMSVTNEVEKRIIVEASPCAWSHINLLGYYQFFCSHLNEKTIDRFIKQWDWRKNDDLC